MFVDLDIHYIHHKYVTFLTKIFLDKLAVHLDVDMSHFSDTWTSRHGRNLIHTVHTYQ